MKNIICPVSKYLLVSLLLAATSTGCSSCSGEPQGENTAPNIELDVQQLELNYTVGDIITITVLGNDDDRDPVTLSYEAKVDNDLSTIGEAQWFPNGGMATFRWTPDSPDVTGDKPIELIFIVRDDRGGYVDRKVTININPGNGVPRFDGSKNEMYRDCCEKPISLEIRVRDDDSESVQLTMRDNPTGADFSPIGKDGSFTRGRFVWKPTAEQAKQRIHNVVFEANDGTSAPVQERYTIIIPQDDGLGIDVRQEDVDLTGICAGNEIIEYTKHVPKRVNLPTDGSQGNPNINTILIEAKLTDVGAQTYDDIFLDWSLKDPLTNTDAEDPLCKDDPNSDACLEKKKNEDESLQIQSTVNPNTGATSWTVNYELFYEDDEKTYFYRVCAIDTDRNADDPNQIVCSPFGKPMYHSFRTYRDPSAECLDDSVERFGNGNDSFDDATRASIDTWERAFVCEGNPDFYSIEVKPGAKMKPSIVYSPESNVQVKLYNQDRQDISEQLDQPSCGGLVSADLSVPSSATASETYYMEVTGDDAIYHFQSIALVKAPEDSCVDDSLEPNDTSGKATLLQPGPQEFALCTEDDIDLYKIDLNAGDQLALTMSFASANDNIADLTVFKPSQASTISKTASGDAYTFAFSQVEEPLSYVAKECGTHYVLVFAADGSSTGNYTLQSTVSAAACQDDDMYADTCNHNQGDAVLIPSEGDLTGLKLCPGSEDWFKVAEFNGLFFLGVITTSEGSVDDLDFDIFNQSGDKVSSADAGELTYTFPDSDFYYIRIKSNADSSVTYDMSYLIDNP